MNEMILERIYLGLSNIARVRLTPNRIADTPTIRL
jgi:hypothetical protein